MDPEPNHGESKLPQLLELAAWMKKRGLIEGCDDPESVFTFKTTTSGTAFLRHLADLNDLIPGFEREFVDLLARNPVLWRIARQNNNPK